MDGLSFRLADPTAALGDARRLAVADARARATTLAEEAGVSSASVVAIVEGGVIPPGPPHPTAEFAMKASADASTPVEAGTSELDDLGDGVPSRSPDPAIGPVSARPWSPGGAFRPSDP